MKSIDFMSCRRAQVQKGFDLVLLAIILLVTAVVYSGALQGKFLNWDDDIYVVENMDIREFSLKNGLAHFSSMKHGLYNPLTMLSFSIEYRLYGLDPIFFHLDNLLLHLVNTILVYCLFLVLTGSRTGAFLGGLLFGLHPVHVEAVAWISGRKELLCGLFYLLGMILYSGRKKKLALVVFIMALLSKPTAVSFPLVLLAMDYLNKRRDWKRALAEKIPFFILSALFSLIAYWAQDAYGAIPEDAKGVSLMNFGLALWNAGNYLFRCLLPFNLSPYYSVPQWHILSPSIFGPLILLAAGAMWALAAAKGHRIRVFGILLFLFTILPVIKLIPFGATVAADRFLYLPSIGILLVLVDMLIRRGKIAVSLGCAYAAAFGLMVVGQVGVWKDSRSLWETVLEKEPGNVLANNAYGSVLAAQKNSSQALVHFERALKDDPGYQKARMNMALSLSILGRLDEAEAEYRRVIREASAEKVDMGLVFFNLGVLLNKTGRKDEAIRSWKNALLFNPRYERARLAMNQVEIRGQRSEGRRMKDDLRFARYWMPDERGRKDDRFAWTKDAVRYAQYQMPDKTEEVR